MEPVLILPDYFDDLVAFETEEKGYLCDVRVIFGRQEITVDFYDPVRLSQEVAADIERGRAFAVQNLLVIPKVTVDEMNKTVQGERRTFFDDTDVR